MNLKGNVRKMVGMEKRTIFKHWLQVVIMKNFNKYEKRKDKGEGHSHR